jgi:hypothetical protein
MKFKAFNENPSNITKIFPSDKSGFGLNSSHISYFLQTDQSLKMNIEVRTCCDFIAFTNFFLFTGDRET